MPQRDPFVVWMLKSMLNNKLTNDDDRRLIGVALIAVNSEIAKRPAPCTWPHCEKNGILCSTPCGHDHYESRPN